jgi:hypothetical protein
MSSIPLIRRAGGRNGGIGGMLAVFLLLTVAAIAIAAIVTAQRREPEITRAKASSIAPQLDRIRPGATEQQVREAFGKPNAVQTTTAGSDRCLVYTNLPSAQPAYRFCFEGGRLELVSAQ